MTKCGWIGIDVGGTGIKAGLVVDGDVFFESHIRTDVSSDAAILTQLCLLSEQLLHHAEGVFSVSGIGVAVPGTVDAERGLALGAANLPWKHTPITEFLAEKTALPVFLENDTNAAAVGEAAFGAGKGASDLFYIAIGTGIGGGAIINGQLYPGGQSKDAGEIGHIVVAPGGPRCRCGQIGCLEAVASAPVIGRRGREAGLKAGTGILWEIASAGEEIDAKTVFDACKQGDKAAAQVIDDIGRYLAVGLVAVRRILAPDLVVVGGGVAAGGNRLLAAIERGWKDLGGIPITLRLAALSQPGVVGAAAVAMSRLAQDGLSPEDMSSRASQW